MVFVMEDRTKKVRDFVLKRAFLVEISRTQIHSLYLTHSSVKNMMFLTKNDDDVRGIGLCVHHFQRTRERGRTLSSNKRSYTRISSPSTLSPPPLPPHQLTNTNTNNRTSSYFLKKKVKKMMKLTAASRSRVRQLRSVQDIPLKKVPRPTREQKYAYSKAFPKELGAALAGTDVSALTIHDYQDAQYYGEVSVGTFSVPLSLSYHARMKTRS